MVGKDKCSYDGCKSKRGIVNGYCRVHHWHSDPPSSPTNQNIKNKELNKQLEAMMITIKGLQRETLELNNQLSVQGDQNKELKDENLALKKENGDLKQRINLNFLAADKQNQHGRLENVRIRNYPEVAERKKDHKQAVKAVTESAAKMGVTVS